MTWSRDRIEHLSAITEAAAAFIAVLAAANVDSLADPERVDELTALERVKSAAFARQAMVTDAFARSQQARLLAAGSKPADVSRSVCAQVGLARRDSPTKGNRHVGLARALVREMPGCWPCCRPVGAVSGGPRSSPGRPRTWRGATRTDRCGDWR